MTIELTMLALAVVLGLVQIVLSAQSKNLVNRLSLGGELPRRAETAADAALPEGWSGRSPISSRPSRYSPPPCSSRTRPGGTTG